MRNATAKKNLFAESKAMKVAQEAINADRTVTTFSLERHFKERFEAHTELHHKWAENIPPLYMAMTPITMAKWALNWVGFPELACSIPITASI